jgi:hypothetical protein
MKVAGADASHERIPFLSRKAKDAFVRIFRVTYQYAFIQHGNFYTAS